MTDAFSLPVIGVVESPFREKFGLPRQPGLIDFTSTIRMIAPYSNPQAFAGLQRFSHVWVSFIFHQAVSAAFSPAVRPPRLGGNRKMGVFATRSPYRPSSLGLSLVKLLSVDVIDNGIVLSVNGLDAIDSTPVVDIRPYIPYAESLQTATAGFAAEQPQPRLSVTISDKLQAAAPGGEAEMLRIAVEAIALDPRPAYRRNEMHAEYGIQLGSWNFRWRISETGAEIFDIVKTE